jgi:hypothetical protein
MKTLQIQSAQYEVQIIDESPYASDSADNPRSYARDYLLTSRHGISSKHAVIANRIDGEQHSAIIQAGGGGSTVHAHSALILNDRLFVAVGDSICCLTLPALDFEWACAVDTATCFGVYFSPENQCLISHGECNVARVSPSGVFEWSASGKDIFTEGFQLFSDHIEVIDFNHETYHIEIASGRISLVGGPTRRAADPPSCRS